MKKSFRIGHYTDATNITGCTVILPPQDTVASCHIAGSAPGSREVILLDPTRKIETIHGLFLTGRSAFGLNAAAGVVQYLEENKIGYKTPFASVPLVPAAVIYDLNMGDPQVRPGPEEAYNTCVDASEDFSLQGCIGAGTGATVGKWAGIKSGMKGGFGTTLLTRGEVYVRVVVVVNSVGDIVLPDGKILAGAIDKNRKFIAANDPQIRWNPPDFSFGQNTILAVLLTNAKLSKLQAHLMAKRAQNGLARAVIPATTSFDGDIIFTLAAGEVDAQPDLLFEMGAEALQRAIYAGVQNAQTMGGFLSVRDLQKESEK